ncbi:hypothetical protein Pcinc_038705 [Petrolisthes cinctipes]|uniref:G-protein coupled receptors family 1 profile domain-containing protein n=1 Tax=Petrolisthes cinctipes TaxID=88211 RepID=A0AAE1EMR0_PETCI|nr:hypothetical protein Pcinc_038705 [Petrolisthes cinctipes]
MAEMNATHVYMTHLQLKKNIYSVTLPVLMSFTVCACVVSGVVVASVPWIKRPMSPTVCLSLSLAAANTFFSLVLSLCFAIHMYLPSVWEYHVSGCLQLCLEVVRLASILLQVLHLLLVALNHYVGILRPLHYAVLATPSTLKYLLLSLWFIPCRWRICFLDAVAVMFVVFGAVPGQGFQSDNCSNNQFYEEGFESSTAPCELHHQSAPATPSPTQTRSLHSAPLPTPRSFLTSYALTLVPLPMDHQKFRLAWTGVFFGPTVVMVVVYCRVLHSLAHRAALSPVTTNLQQRSQIRKHIKTVRTTALIVVTYLVGWGPAVLKFLLVCSKCIISEPDFTTNMFIGIACNALFAVKVFTDTFIYAVRLHDIREALCAMCGVARRYQCGCGSVERMSGRRGPPEVVGGSTKYPLSSLTGSIRMSLNSPGLHRAEQPY